MQLLCLAHEIWQGAGRTVQISREERAELWIMQGKGVGMALRKGWGQKGWSSPGWNLWNYLWNLASWATCLGSGGEVGWALVCLVSSPVPCLPHNHRNWARVAPRHPAVGAGCQHTAAANLAAWPSEGLTCHRDLDPRWPCNVPASCSYNQMVWSFKTLLWTHLTQIVVFVGQFS